MTPEEFSRIREIYEQVLTMAGIAREAFLERECSGHSVIRAEVERLLQAQGSIPDWLDRPAFGVASPPSGFAPSKMEGRQIGGYTILREIGTGGMGCVYLAERSDGTFRKQVAIKIVRPPYSADLIARFQQERRILASLDHPNIARLIDGGTTEEGWPYFVMEYVDGQPIHRWCDEHKLNISHRLELFQGVLAAVRYAHQRLVVHRDLKPGNILVTQDGTVKLLDFGIAKIMAADAEKEPETVTLAAMMTPEYASPEQVTGAPVTTLSDVYSLGVILYELLTGHRPYRLLSAAMHEVVRVIAEVEPPRPSEIVTTTEHHSARDQTSLTPATVSAVREGDPKRLSRRLAGDLDSILLMALRKEPGQRYRSVEQFGGDLERHLAGQSVSARKGAFSYRAGKFIARNRLSLVWACVLIVAAVLYFVDARYRAIQSQQEAAQDLFYSMKYLDVDIAGLERIALDGQPNAAPLPLSRQYDFSKLVAGLRGRRRELETNYDRLLNVLHFPDLHTTQERLVLRVSRAFGECELTVPSEFLADVQTAIGKWQRYPRFPSDMRRAIEKGYPTKMAQELSARNLPPELLYIALLESGFQEQISGPITPKGIAKGMWQLLPETAVRYGLKIGPLADVRSPDPADERDQWEKSTRATAQYLKDLYSGVGQASALLTIAYYSYGEFNLMPAAIQAMKEDPRQRNFWRLFSLHRDLLSRESYDYVVGIVAAAVIGENPRLFGFDFDNPLRLKGR